MAGFAAEARCDFILTEDTGTGGTETTEERKTDAKRFLLALARAKRRPRNPHERIVALSGLMPSAGLPAFQSPGSPGAECGRLSRFGQNGKRNHPRRTVGR